MGDYFNLERAQQFLAVRSNRKRLSVILVTTALLLLIGIIFSSYSIVNISYEGDGATNVDSVSAHAYSTIDEQRLKLNSVFGLLMVPRATETLLITAGEAETIVNPKNSFPSGYSSLNVELRKPVKAKKLSSGGGLCPLVNGTGVYSSECDNPSAFSKYTEQSGGIPGQVKTLDFNSQYISSQYQDGILAWYNGSPALTSTDKDAIVSYIVPGKGIVGTLKMHDDINKSMNYIRIITDNSNQSNTGFVVYDYSEGIGYYYGDFAAAATSKRVTRQYKLNTTTESSSCTLLGTIFSCYHGSSGEDSHDHSSGSQDKALRAQESETEQTGGVIEVTDMKAGAASTKVYTAPAGTRFDDLYTITNGTLFGRNGFILERIELADGSFISSPIVRNTQLISSGATLYYSQNSKIYKYNEETGNSTLHYYDKDEVTSKLVIYDTRPLSLSYNKRDPMQLLNLYDLAAGTN